VCIYIFIFKKRKKEKLSQTHVRAALAISAHATTNDRTHPSPIFFGRHVGPIHSLTCSPNFSLRSCSDVLDGPAAAAFLQLPLSPSSFPLLSSHLSPSLPCSLSPTCAAPVRRRDGPCTLASPSPTGHPVRGPGALHRLRPAQSREPTPDCSRRARARLKSCPTRCFARTRSRTAQAPCTARPFDFSPLMELQLLRFFLIPLFLSLKPTPLSSVMELNADRSLPGRPSLSSPSLYKRDNRASLPSPAYPSSPRLSSSPVHCSTPSFVAVRRWSSPEPAVRRRSHTLAIRRP
jgi:hypothetical protein